LISLGFMAHAADPVLLKTGPEVYASYVSITGVSATDPDVKALYTSDIKRLPLSGQSSDLNNNTVLALTELGGLFCQKAITREIGIPASQRTLFPNVDFTQGTAQFDTYTQGQVFENLALAFWQRDVSAAETASLSTTLQAALQGVGTTSDQTRNVAQIICTVYASSIGFLTK
jgi:hypothetical protein